MKRRRRILNRCSISARHSAVLAAVTFAVLLSGCGSILGKDTPDASAAALPVSPSASAAAETASASAAASVPPAAADEDLVEVPDYIPSLYVDLKYATKDNFTGQVIYDFSDARLRYGTVKKLAAVQSALAQQGFSLKIWDAYRPVSAQVKLWQARPDPVYVADPNKGFSKHSRGNTVDVTLVRADGTEIEMPSAFDEHSALADRDYSDVSQTAKANALLLENAMTAGGFQGYSGEWWHYSDSTDYPVIRD